MPLHPGAPALEANYNFIPAAKELLVSARGPSSGEQVLRSLLGLVPGLLSFLPEANSFDPKVWPAQPASSANGTPFGGVEKVIAQCQNLFRECCAVLGAERMILLSTWEQNVEHAAQVKRYHLLVSSDPKAPPVNASIDSALLPQVLANGISQRVVFVGAPIPPAAFDSAGLTRERPLGEYRAEAVVPVLGSKRVEAAVVIQFDKECEDEDTRRLLAEAGAFLRRLENDYNKIDFLCRIYREAKLPVAA